MKIDQLLLVVVVVVVQISIPKFVPQWPALMYVIHPSPILELRVHPLQKVHSIRA